jgi:dTDP-4-dehydrorhamnose 3,5-epimerase
MKILSKHFDNSVLLIEPKVFGDERGCFMETWNRRAFDSLGIAQDFVQDNQSYSIQGTLRGLHFQDPHAQGKLVWVVEGEVFDVAVDIRKESATFGKWIGFSLSSSNHHRVWIPPGFAHGFYVKSKTAHVAYKCTDFYAPGCEHSLLWNDPEIGIKWPLPRNSFPLLSPKDQAGLPLAALFS